MFSLSGVSVAIKDCPTRGNVVRFQEHHSGFHNFNNRVFLTLPLCELLLSGLAVRHQQMLCMIHKQLRIMKPF